MIKQIQMVRIKRIKIKREIMSNKSKSHNLKKETRTRRKKRMLRRHLTKVKS